MKLAGKLYPPCLTVPDGLERWFNQFRLTDDRPGIGNIFETASGNDTDNGFVDSNVLLPDHLLQTCPGCGCGGFRKYPGKAGHFGDGCQNFLVRNRHRFTT